ncbi:MAG: EamA family transporter [Haliscomenobacter sp.]|nr:EamA family transporter [Haliscomenobacter sp.]
MSNVGGIAFRLDRKQVFASFLILVSALCFSAKAVLIKMAYRYEVDSISLLTLRMAFALPFFLAIAWWSRPKHGDGKARLRAQDWLEIIVYGLLGYYFASLFDFMGLQYVSAGMERLILYLYPTMVLLLSAVLFRKKVLRSQLIALALTYAGIAVAFLDGQNLTQGSDVLFGGFLILMSAIAYAVYLLGTATLLPKLGTLRYTSLAISAGCIAIILQHGIQFQWDLWGFPAPVYWLSLLMAMLSTVLPTFLVSEGVRMIGAGNASIIGSIGPVSTIALAYWFLGEGFGFWQLVGTLLVTGGVVYISLAKREKN